MKKIKFLSGINAMFALAAVALATTFTSCEEEELSINLKPQVATLTIDATVVVIDDGTTVETKSFTKTETSQAGSSIPAGSFAVNHSYTFEDGYVGTVNETVEYPTVLPGQSLTLTPTFIIAHNCVFPEPEEPETTIVYDETGASVESTTTTIDKITSTNPSEYSTETTIEYDYNKGTKLVDWGVTDAATPEEYVKISQYVKNFNNLKEEKGTYNLVVDPYTEVVVEITQVRKEKTVKVYRRTVDATRAADVEIGWYIYLDYAGVSVDTESTTLEDGKPGHDHGHGHGHGHGEGNAGGGIITD